MAKTKSDGNAPYDEWQVQEDLRTLARAREIKADPKRLAAVRELANKQMVAAAAAAADAEDKDD